MQNAGLAAGTTPAGEKLTLTTISNTKASKTCQLEVQCQNPSSIPLVRHSALRRLLTMRSSLPAKEVPYLDILDFQVKLLGIQKTLHEISDMIAEVNGEENVANGKVTDGDRPRKKEENLRKLLEAVGKCMSLYEHSRMLLGKEFML